ncbi:MAG: NAD(P)-dependent oxidoreductase [Elainellaceae cyanobacterium]
MKLLVTGSSGFVGRHVVEAAIRHGHQVCAMLRSRRDRTLPSWSNHPSVELFDADLSDPTSLETLPAGIDGVIHLVASKSGDWDEAYRGTVITTQNLLQAMEKAQLFRLTLISSFSVYDYSHASDGSLLDETWPMDNVPSQRDAYAQTKIIQEKLVREFADRHPNEVAILRPGMIFGRDMLWNACHGLGLGPVWLRIGNQEILPLSYVENCAEAIIKATETPAARDQTLNIVDDILPSRQEYTQALQELTHAYSLVVPVNWSVMRNLASFASTVNNTLAQGKLKVPGLLTPSRLEARFKPLNFSNQRAKECLEWQPRYSWRKALSRSYDQELSLPLMRTSQFNMKPDH